MKINTKHKRNQYLSIMEGNTMWPLVQHTYNTLDDVLEVNFNFHLTNDAFLSPKHKTLFDFTLAYP